MTGTPTVAETVGAWLTRHDDRFDIFVAAATVGISAPLILGSPENFDAGWPEAAAGVGAFVLTALRRSRPFALLAVAVAWSAAHIAILERPSSMTFAALVLLATATMRLNRWPALALGLTVGVALFGAALVMTDLNFADPRALIAVAWTAVAVGVGDATRSWRRYRESAEAQARSAMLASEAQARRQVIEERLSIARELHDLLGHNLSVMNVQTGAAMHLLRSNPDQAEAALQTARDAGRDVLDELSELLSVLRHDDTDTGPDSDTNAPLAALPTVDDVAALVERVRSTGLDVTWTETGARRPLAPAVSLAAYRIVQEGLTNSAKHGPGTAHLTTAWDDHAVTITIANPTVETAAPQAPGGHGLVGMQERAVGNGGTFTAGSAEGRFVVRVTMPVLRNRSEVNR